jgi:hexosaminidase
MVDPARRYLTPKALRTILDGMATEKLNILHLHLTDDQSFPLQLPHHPELTGPFAPRLNYSAEVGLGI